MPTDAVTVHTGPRGEGARGPTACGEGRGAGRWPGSRRLWSQRQPPVSPRYLRLL